MKNTAGFISEIFTSLQGEGLLLGEPQIFIRFAGCNIRCNYCDTPGSLTKTSQAFIEGKGPILNPVNTQTILDEVQKINTASGPFHSISITGGEPLVQGEFLIMLARQLKQRSYRLFLETNATRPEIIKGHPHLFDWFSMDWKLSDTLKGKSFKKEHLAFLELTRESYIYIKIVLSSKFEDNELFEALTLIADIRTDITIILQPVTPFNHVNPPSIDAIITLQKRALKIMQDVRIIPQVHKYLQIK